MKVTIIGGSGFIGTRIVDHFTQFKGCLLYTSDAADDVSTV